MKLRCTLLLAGSIFLLACESAPECHVLEAHVDSAVANAGCMLRHGNGLLVVTQRESGRLSIPAGASKAGESAQCTAHRETWEETGIAVSVGKLLREFDNGFRLYECKPLDPTLDPTQALRRPLSSRLEISEARWIRPQDIEEGRWRYRKQLPQILELFEQLPE